MTAVDGARAVPARGIRNPAPGQPGHRLAGTRTGPRGARCTGGMGNAAGAASGHPSREARPELTPADGNPVRGKTAAERRKASAPGSARFRARASATFAGAARTVDGMRLSALCLPHCICEGGKIFGMASWLAELGRGARRENAFVFPRGGRAGG